VKQEDALLPLLINFALKGWEGSTKRGGVEIEW
jgi:hypothetical protein